MTKKSGPDIPVARQSRPTLQNQVYERMRDALLVGRLKPGQKMTNRHLATALGVSVTPVREALQRLVAEHVLTMLPSGSVIVPVLSEAEIVELHKVTKALEGLAARIALEKVDRDFLQSIMAQSGSLQAAYQSDNWPTVIEANYKLHFKLYELAESPYLLTLISGLWMRKGPHYTSFFPVHYSRHRGSLFLDIVSAFEAGRLDRAGEAFETLIDREFETWIMISRQEGPPVVIDDPIDSSVFAQRDDPDG